MADERRRILFCKWQPDLLGALLDLGAEIHLVLDRYDVMHESPSEELLGRCRQVYRVSGFDTLEELSAIAVDLRTRGQAIDLVLSHNELSQFGAGYLELLLGLATDPLVHVSHRDKRLMKQRVRDAGVPTARFMSLPDPTDRAAVAAVGAALPMPVVVKPAAGYGAMSTLRADTPEQLAEIAANFQYAPLLRSRQLIVEEFVDGQEMCVDAIWSDGKPLTLVGHRYHVPRLAMARGGGDPEASSLDGSRVVLEEDRPEVFAQVREIHERINGALGIHDGATHMEVFIRPDGEVLFSEIGTRVGGAWTPELLTAHLGHSIWRLVAQATLSGTIPPQERAHRYIGTVHVRPAKPGVITTYPTEAELAEFPGVIDWHVFRKVGDKARLSHPSEWYLFVVFGAETTEEIDELRVRVADRFAIETVAS